MARFKAKVDDAVEPVQAESVVDAQGEPIAAASMTFQQDAPAVTKLKVRTVYGDMLDLATNVKYTQIPQDIDSITPWLRSQLDAGKMELV